MRFFLNFRAGSRQQAAGSRQQAAGSRQQAADYGIGAFLALVLILCTVVLSGCRSLNEEQSKHYGYISTVYGSSDSKRIGEIQKGTATAQVYRHTQGEMSVNGKTLLVRERLIGTDQQGAEANEYTVRKFWRFWNISNKFKLFDDLLANEGVFIDAYLRARRWELSEHWIDSTCISTKDISIGLSVAYLDNDGAIVTIFDMLPNVAPPLWCASKPVRGALLMPYGWFEANNVKPGDVVSEFKYVTINRRKEIIDQWPAPPARQRELAEIEKSYIPALSNGRDAIIKATVLGRWIGQRQKKEARLIVKVPQETLDQQNRIETLRPWEGLLYYIDKQNYYDKDSLIYSVKNPTSETLSVATLTSDGTIVRMFDVDANENITLREKDAERYALVAPPGWLEAHASMGDKVSSFNPVEKSQLSRLVVNAQQTYTMQTQTLMALVRQKRAQDAQFRVIERDFNRFREYYDIDVKLAYHNARISGNRDSLPGFWGRLFGNDGSNLSARAWQCSDRSYTVTIRPKRPIDYVDEARNPYPLVINATWKLSHVLGGNTSDQGSTSRELKLPLRPAESLSETFTFNCIDDMHTAQGEETSSELRMALADQSSFQIHRSTSTAHINRDAVYAENSRQWNLLSQAIDEHNARVAARQGRQAGGTGNHPGYVRVDVDMTCGIMACTRKGSSASAVNGTFDIKPDHSGVVFWGIGGAATGRVRITSTFDSTTCTAEVNIVDGNDYDLNFTTNCDIGYFQAR